jgi:cell division protein FtsQ
VWDRPQMLLWFASLLTGLAVLLFMYAALLVLVHSPLFPVRQIHVGGELAHVSREQLQYIVKHELKGTFFTMDLERARHAFEKLPWVRTVGLRRRWPDQVEVKIEEHVALARWGNAGLVNTLGERFDAATSETLPVLDGPEGSEAEIARGYRTFQTLLKTIDRPASRVSLSPRRAWRLELDKKLTVELGREDAEQRLRKFVEAYPRTIAIINRPVDYVDLRYPNGFAVSLPGYVPKTAKKEAS